MKQPKEAVRLALESLHHEESGSLIERKLLDHHELHLARYIEMFADAISAQNPIMPVEAGTIYGSELPQFVQDFVRNELTNNPLLHVGILADHTDHNIHSLHVAIFSEDNECVSSIMASMVGGYVGIYSGSLHQAKPSAAIIEARKQISTQLNKGTKYEQRVKHLEAAQHVLTFIGQQIVTNK